MNRWRGSIHQLFAVGLLGCACLGLVGCGGGVGDLAGTVTYNTKGLQQGTVSVASSSGSIHTGVIQEDGSYSIAGIPSGMAKVSVSSPDPRKVKVAQRKKDEKPPPPDTSKWFAIPEKYGDAGQSGLTTDIATGKNTFNIDLK